MRVLRPDEVQKVAAGTVEAYMPWYTAALGGAGGGLAGQHLAKGTRYEIPALLAGTLLGTAAGVHGGEAVGRAVDERVKGRLKTAAEEQSDKERLKRVLKVMGTSAAGTALGTLAGAGAGFGGAALYNRLAKRPVPLRYVVGAPALIGAGLGLAVPIKRAIEKREMDRAIQGESDKT